MTRITLRPPNNAACMSPLFACARAFVKLFVAVVPREYNTAITAVLGVVCVMPPLVMMSLLGVCIREHTMFCNIEFMRREDIVDRVVGEARLRKCKTAVRLVRAMYVVTEHKRAWSDGERGSAFDIY